MEEIFKEDKINWPQEIDFNWQKAWEREVLEETGVNLDNIKDKIILDFKFNHTLMMGSEKDRLTNVDGRFCAFLGELTTEPQTTPDNEVEEVRWIALEEIDFHLKQQKYLALNKEVNAYAISTIEESLYKIICYKIKEISKIDNFISKQKISKFNTPQNLQSFLLEKLEKLETSEKQGLRLDIINEFLLWNFAELEIARNIYGKKGDLFFKTSINICYFITKNKIDFAYDLKKLEQFLEKNLFDPRIP